MKTFGELIPGDKVYCITFDRNYNTEGITEKRILDTERSGIITLFITIESMAAHYINPEFRSFATYSPDGTHTFVGMDMNSLKEQVEKFAVERTKQIKHQTYMLEQKVRRINEDLKDLNKEAEMLENNKLFEPF